jgi:hypothetical protein
MWLSGAAGEDEAAAGAHGADDLGGRALCTRSNRTISTVRMHLSVLAAAGWRQ